MVQQALVRWSVPGDGSGVSVIHYGDSATPAEISSSLSGFFTATRACLASDSSVTADPVVRQLDTATGALTGEVTIDITGAGAATGGSGLVPNAAQGLIRWRTSGIVNGRYLRGRMYVPGLPAAAVNATGGLNGLHATRLLAMGTALGIDTPIHVWHRPTNGAGGQSFPVTAVSVWSELAVQRRRRV